VADKDIKQRIVLEGEKEYSSALKEAQRNLKVLRSELKAESAELGKNATEQQKNEAKLKNLQKQIKEQEKVVKTYEKALQEVREKYGDNEDAIAKWEIKLNDARTALANMRNSIEDTGRSMNAISSGAEMGVVATNSLADSLSKVADTGSMISGALENAFTSIVGTIADTVSQVWESVVDLAARSNNIVDLAGFWNTDPTKIQQWAGAVSHASGSLEDIASIVTKINSGDAKKIAELTGVSDVNYQDRWEYAMAVMDALSKMSKLQRNEAAFDIFGGKQATKAFDLLNDWNTVLEHLSDFDAENGGFGLSEDQLQTMSDLYDKVNGLKASWQALKDMATVELFGKLALDITGNLQNIVEAFKDYFNADDDAGKQAALDKIKENIVAIFERVKEAIHNGLELLNQLASELKNSDDSVLQMLGTLLEQIVGALDWFTKPENWETVKRGFEAIIGIWATGKITDAIGHMASFGSHLATIGKFFGWGSGGSAAASAGTAAASSGGGGFWNALFAKVFPVAAGAGIVIADSLNNHGSNDISGAEFLEMAKNGDEYAKSVTDLLYARYGYSISDLGKNGLIDQVLSGSWTTDQELFDRLENQHGWKSSESLVFTDGMRQAAEAFWDAWRDDNEFTDEEYEAYESAFEGFPELLDKMDRLFEALADKYDFGDEEWNSMEDLPADWWTNQNGLTSEDVSSFRTLPNNISAAVRNGVSNIRVTMDGQTVGRLVAPYVSEQIARDMV